MVKSGENQCATNHEPDRYITFVVLKLDVHFHAGIEAGISYLTSETFALGNHTGLGQSHLCCDVTPRLRS